MTDGSAKRLSLTHPAEASFPQKLVGELSLEFCREFRYLIGLWWDLWAHKDLGKFLEQFS